jgi:hypothetical protein
VNLFGELYRENADVLPCPVWYPNSRSHCSTSRKQCTTWTGTLIPGSITMSPMLMLPFYRLPFDFDPQPRNNSLVRNDRAGRAAYLYFPEDSAVSLSVLRRWGHELTCIWRGSFPVTWSPVFKFLPIRFLLWVFQRAYCIL